jgi:hypothetical protein
MVLGSTKTDTLSGSQIAFFGVSHLMPLSSTFTEILMANVFITILIFKKGVEAQRDSTL